jgi:hypothetical protein
LTFLTVYGIKTASTPLYVTEVKKEKTYYDYDRGRNAGSALRLGKD